MANNNNQAVEPTSLQKYAAKFQELQEQGRIERINSPVPPPPQIQSAEPAPSTMAQQPDQQRQWRNPAQPQLRTIPLPQNQTLASGSQAVSQTIKALPTAIPVVVPAVNSKGQVDMSKATG